MCLFVLVGLGLGDAGGQGKPPQGKKPKQTKPPPGVRVLLSGVQVKDGKVTEVGVVVPTPKGDLPELFEVNKSTRFVFVSGKTRKTLHRHTVLTDPAGKEYFRANANIFPDANGRTAKTITFGP